MNILIVEDEKRLAEALCQIMKSQKYMADVVGNGQDGLDYAIAGAYDLVILDVMLPKLDGFQVVQRMREKKVATPVLLLTAKDEVQDKVQGLDCGADDYMTKPFSNEELLARVRALTRRQGEVVLDKLSFADLTLELSTCALSCGQKSVHLGFKEYEIMKILLSNQNAITPKETLITKVWGSESFAEDNNVEAHISFLRKKFSYLGSKAVIETARKVGYMLSSR
ncbi:MAG: response regulator transcription factor [Clostridiales bacterium]|nr:response regulator transcription factor [Clostridiales bacterium]MDR2751233.1 response regulator transcription factor [Clostridiales bacterium]